MKTNWTASDLNVNMHYLCPRMRLSLSASLAEPETIGWH